MNRTVIGWVISGGRHCLRAKIIQMYMHRRFAYVVFLIGFLLAKAFMSLTAKQETRLRYSPVYIQNYSPVNSSVTPDIAKIDYYSVYRGMSSNTDYYPTVYIRSNCLIFAMSWVTELFHRSINMTIDWHYTMGLVSRFPVKNTLALIIMRDDDARTVRLWKENICNNGEN